jgi:hypothetical protein
MTRGRARSGVEESSKQVAQVVRAAGAKTTNDVDEPATRLVSVLGS